MSATFTPEQLANGRKWVDALRSGKYKQGKKCLRTFDDEYCCLGVAADLFMPDHWMRGDMEWINDNAWLVLPDALPPLLGLSSNNPNVDPRELTGGQAICLAECNDYGLTFDEIATIIETEIYRGQLPPSEVSK